MRADPSAETYRLHGLRIRSEVPLYAPPAGGPGHDFELTIGERRPVPSEAPPGRALARLQHPGGSSTLASSGGSYVLRSHGLCDFEIDGELSSARFHASADADPEVPSLLASSLLATVMTLRGNCVLHGSAVELGGRAVAFVGASGRGKTTVAALCCVAGARLVSDDVLRVEAKDGRGWCFSGSPELRLRPAATGLSKSLNGAGVRSTIDGRLAVTPPTVSEARLPLCAIVAPICDREASSPQIDRLRGADAVRVLVSSPRTVGWIDGKAAQRDFSVLMRLARSVPVFGARLPWGPESQPRLAQTLLSRLGLDPRRAAIGAGP